MREKFQVINGFVLKLLGFVLTMLDHVGYYMEGMSDSAARQVGFVFRIIGRIAFPIFAFLVAQGMHYTKKPGHYILRLGILATVCSGGLGLLQLVSKPLFNQTNYGAANAITDLFFGALFLLCLRQKGWKKVFAIFPLAFFGLAFGVSFYESITPGMNIFSGSGCVWFPLVFRPDYGPVSLLIIIAFFMAYPLANLISSSINKKLEIDNEEYKKTKEYRSLVNTISVAFFFVIVLIFWGLSYVEIEGVKPFLWGLHETNSHGELLNIQTYCLIVCPILLMYNGLRGHDSKAWRIASYAFFPVHMIIIYFIFALI
ncbi:MAG: conjugal transfer protein TraX [Bacilli bacterium]|nr:conjugal transfer protein TraX [Bacilli bacterium]